MNMGRKDSVRRSISGLGRALSLTRGAQQNGEAQAAADNKTIFQGFEWYTESAASHSHWKRLTTMLPYLKSIGIHMIWLPPGCKAAHADSTGYDIYDLYDLGEFNQKNGRRTKWGTKEELLDLVAVAKKYDVGIMWDAVLNHKAAADATEDAMAVKCDPEDRRKEIATPKSISAWTSFDFPGRGSKYSAKRWTATDFTGIDYDAITQKPGIYKFLSPSKPPKQNGWATDVDSERGNYDYLMFADIDHRVTSVRADLFNWADWITNTLGLAGMRLDAMKHYSTAFQVDLVRHLQEQHGRDFFVVGEYWTWNALTLSNIIGKFKGRISLYDVQLVYNFSDFSKEHPKPETPVGGDLRRIFEGALLQMHPQRSVTFVANHDTQEGQSLEAPVAPWFVPHAYALILLRQEGQPCVFYGDLFGNNGPKARTLAAGGRLPRLVAARQKYAYGRQKDYFDQADCVGWTRSGSPNKSEGAGLAVLVNSSWEVRNKKMFVGNSHRGEVWTDLMGWAWGEVVIDEWGQATFPVAARGVSVWANKGAKARDKIDRLVWDWQGWDDKEVEEREKGQEKKKQR